MSLHKHALRETSECTDTFIELPIKRGRGRCFVRNVEALFGAGNINNHPTDSRLFVFEDGKPLGPPHTPVGLIERDGKGSFCHWGGVLYFSASDDSDPNANGRTYTMRLSDELYFSERYEYSYQQVKWFFEDLKITPDYVKGKRILEVGPGRDVGFGLIMAGLGAMTVGVEKYRPGWIENWHPAFIDAICTHAPARFPGFDPAPLRYCQKINDFDAACIDFHQTAMEEFSTSQREKFDISCSLAVLEHVCDPEIVTQNLYMATKPGGLGLHCIDFRDHREFSTPLEFLLLDDQEYEKSNGDRRYWVGNRVLSGPYLKHWQNAGFKNINYYTNSKVDEAYLQNFLPRLRGSQSKFKDTPEEDLRANGVVFSMRR